MIRELKELVELWEDLAAMSDDPYAYWTCAEHLSVLVQEHEAAG